MKHGSQARTSSLSIALALLVVGATGCAEHPVATAPLGDHYRDPLSIAAPIYRFTLQNGLKVLLNRDARSPFVAVDVSYAVGSRDDPPDHPGLTHLVEHLLYSGSRHVPPGGFFGYLEAAGAGVVNGSTGTDVTNLWEVVPASELELALWLEGDRMASGLDVITPADVDHERRVLDLEYAQTVENVPNGRVLEFVEQALADPVPVFAARAPELAQLTLPELQQFFDERYAPGTAALVLSGDFEVNRARQLVERYFAKIPSRAPRARAEPPVAPSPIRQHALQVESSVEVPELELAWRTPALGSAADADLDVFARFLNQHALKDLRLEREVALSITANQCSRHTGSVFLIQAVARPDVSPAQLLEALDAILDRYKTQDPDSDQIRRAARSWSFELYVRYESTVQRAFNIADRSLFDADPRFLNADIERYRGVTARSVSQTVRAYLGSEQRVVAIVSPRGEAPISGRLAAQ